MYVWIFLATVAYLLYQWHSKKPKNFPPGPPRLPFVGSLPFLESNNFHYYLEKARHKYGPLMGFMFGNLPAIAVCGPDEIFEVLKRDDFSGRPSFPNASNDGIFFGNGDSWKDQRRFTHRHLRDFGFGKASSNDTIMSEVEEFCEKKLKGKQIVSANGLFNQSAINILWAMISGKRLSYDNDNLQYLFNLVETRFRTGNVTGGFKNAFPRVVKFISNFYTFEDDAINMKLKSFFKDEIKRHRETRETAPRDFLDVYLEEVENPNKKEAFKEPNLIEICSEFFGAGTESSGNTVSFALLYLLRHPDWQEKLINEIYDALGGRAPTYEDRARFPLTQAFLEETVRCNPIAPLTVPHSTIRATEIAGYSIPKGTMVHVNLWSLFQDKKHWGDPENFRPERFINAEGQFIRDPYMLVFGVGSRVCVGEVLARTFVFIFFVALLQRYRFLLPKGDPLPSTICLSGFTTAPQPFNVLLEPHQ